MSGKITKQDLNLLTQIASFKIITVRQLSVISQRTCQVIRRRLRFLQDEGLIIRRMRGYGRARGRPEEFILLTGEGFALLQKKGTISEQYTSLSDKAANEIPADHDLLLNWFHVHLLQIGRLKPQFSIRCITTNSQPSTDSIFSKAFKFIPDGVFSITNSATKSSLLFFLEVDMGTETMASTSRSSGNDVRHKIINYQSLFGSNRYKLCERIFAAEFNGFRLLFLANTNARLVKLADLVHEMPPSDFIWLTDQDKMFSHGLADKTWVRGGKTHAPTQSILRNMACKASVSGNIK